MTGQVLTANALVAGDVIYWRGDETWGRSLAEACVFVDPDEANSALSAATAQSGAVVGAYLIDVTLSGAMPRPTHFREAFRATGPSNRFHGKQADQTEQVDVSLHRV